MRRRVLVVAMLDSIHTARWLAQFKSEDIDFLLFPSSPQRRIRPELKSLLTSKDQATYRLQPGARWFALPLWFADKILRNFLRATILKFATHKFRPHFLHALELQNAGYLVLDSLPKQGLTTTKIISTNWGSDIYWFRQFPRHESKLRLLLQATDLYSAECQRDVNLALELGFSGQILPVIPNAGGFEADSLTRPVKPLSERRVIAIKGYHGWVGRAKVALGAVELIARSLVGLEIVVYSANSTVVRMARRVAKNTGLKFTVTKKGALSHAEMLELFANAKIYVGISESDGISTSLLESMAMGAIPVQTATSCCSEWFQDSGVSVTVISESAVAKAILGALEIAEHQSKSEKNRQIVLAKASSSDVSKAAKSFYTRHY